MMKKLLAVAVGALFASQRHSEYPVKHGRRAARDVAFTYAMGAGIPGDVNRSHPASIESDLIDPVAPATRYGNAVVASAAGNTVRALGVADAADTHVLRVRGFVVRPFPQQPLSASNSGAVGFGAGTPPVTGIEDVMSGGYIYGQLNDIAAAVVKGQTVYVWCAADNGVHKQGGFEAVQSAGNTVGLGPSYSFNGPADTNGVVEIAAL